MLEAGLMQIRNLKARSETTGEEHPETLASMNDLASTLTFQGKYDLAEYYCQQVLYKMTRVLGEERPATLKSEANLSVILTTQHKYKEAEEISRRVLDRVEQNFGTAHPN